MRGVRSEVVPILALLLLPFGACSESRSSSDDDAPAGDGTAVGGAHGLSTCTQESEGSLYYDNETESFLICLDEELTPTNSALDDEAVEGALPIALEAPGSQCPNGGLRLTDSSGTTYACNGDPGAGCVVQDNGDNTLFFSCDDGAAGAQSVGNSFSWLGAASVPPSDPALYDAYYHSVLGTACLWDGERWRILLEGPSSRGTCEHNDITLGKVLLVDSRTAEGGDGRSWNSAYKYLQDALYCTRESADEGEACEDVEAIWLAEGVYYPDEDEGGSVAEGNPTERFKLPKHIGIYGGFAGNETRLEQRDPAAHVSVLSGDIAQDDAEEWVDEHGVLGSREGLVGTNSLYVVEVVPSSNSVQRATLDGLSVSAGAFLSTQCAWSSGKCPLNLQNVVFSGNDTAVFGHNALMRIEDVAFLNNQSTIRGGGLRAYQCTVELIGVIFSGNWSRRAGGAIQGYESNILLDGGWFLNNSAEETDGGALSLLGGTAQLNDAVFAENTAPSGGGALYARACDLALSNSTFFNNQAGSEPSILLEDALNATVANTIAWVDGSLKEDHIEVNSPASLDISYSLVESGSSAFGGSGLVTFGEGTDFAADGHNISSAPQFVDPENGDFSLKAESPAIEAGDNLGVPPDRLDRDNDGDTGELAPFDLSGAARICDGDGNPSTPAAIDMGAFERCQ